MKSPRKCSSLLALVLLVSLSGCVDFEQEGAAFCQRNPTRCDPSPIPDAGTPDAGTPDTTAPTIIQSSQSATSVLAHETVTFSVTARDEESPQLRFAWSSTAGTLGTPLSTASISEVTWTPPPCSPAGSVITVTVTNSGDLSSTQAFTLSTNPCPIPTVSTSGNHSLALRSDGTVWAWGNNSSGQLGDETSINRFSPVQVTGLSNIAAFAAGYYHSLARRSDGTVWAWGANSSGQLGDGTSTNRLAPVQISSLSSITALAAGSSHSLARRNDGTVWVWGSNSHGQLGDGTASFSRVPMQALLP